MSEAYRLITIPPSHYCEKARWALDRLQVPYREERHPPLLHYPAVRRAGGRRTTPVLVTDHGVFADSTDILEFLDGLAGGRRFFPEDADARREVMELEELFDRSLGPHTRRVAYFHLLPDRRLALQSLLADVPARDRLVYRSTFPLMRFLLRRGLRITQESYERSLGRIRELFATVDERLADGRNFLVGGSFTAADLGFAALASPVLLPRSYGAPLPSLDELPAALLPLIEEMRGSAAGGFALRLFRDER
jgi:glutathione S-transferase